MTRQHERCHNQGMVKTTAALGIALATLLLTGCTMAQPDQTPLPTEFSGTGTFVAGEDIAPGYYEQATPSERCEYYIQNAEGRTYSTNTGAAILIANEGDTVNVAGCAVYEKFQDN